MSPPRRHAPARRRLPSPGELLAGALGRISKPTGPAETSGEEASWPTHRPSSYLHLVCTEGRLEMNRELHHLGPDCRWHQRPNGALLARRPDNYENFTVVGVIFMALLMGLG